MGDAQSNQSPKYFDEGIYFPGFRDVEDTVCIIPPLPSCSPAQIDIILEVLADTSTTVAELPYRTYALVVAILVWSLLILL